MANIEHLKIIQEGANEWNSWRIRNNIKNPDIRGANLREKSLIGINLENADVRGVDFRNAELKNAIFIKSQAGLTPFGKNYLLVIFHFFSVVAGFLAGLIGYVAASPIDPKVNSKFIILGDNFSINNNFPITFEGAIFLSFLIISAIILFLKEILFKDFFSGTKVILILAAISFLPLFLSSLYDPFIYAGFIGILFLAILLTAAFSIVVFSSIYTVFKNIYHDVVIATLASIIAVYTFANNVTHNIIDSRFRLFLLFAGLVNFGFFVAIDRFSCRVINQEEKDLWLRNIAIRIGSSIGTNFQESDLEKANFSEAKLKNTNFETDQLKQTNFYHAKGLKYSKVDNTILENPKVRDLLVNKRKTDNVDFQECDFRKANLSEANLQNIDLLGSNISESTFHKSTLNGVKLINVKALGTNFEEADLTGACIENWKINKDTKFTNVNCRYIYLKNDKEERRPSDPNRNFEPGEFAKLVEKSIHTVDLIFKNGIDWKAFLTSFQGLRFEYGKQNVSIQAIEQKSDGAFVIRLSVPPDANKAEIESKAKQLYETKFQILKSEKNSLLRENARLDNMIYTLVCTLDKRPIMNIDQRDSNIVMNIDQRDSNIGIGHMSGGEIKDDAKVTGNMNFCASEQKPTLAEAAEEIQKLLKQLEQDNPNATLIEQQEFVNMEVPKDLRNKCINALKAGWKETVKEVFDNPYINVGISILEGWKEK